MEMPPNPRTDVLVLPQPASTQFRGTVLDGYYKSEKQRLDSFVGFPNVFVDVGKLAAAGFYFIKLRDIARCAFCRTDIGAWEQGDDPLVEHKKWSPKCPFINGKDVGNMPLNPSNTSTPTESRGSDECGLYGISPIEPLVNVGPLERLGITRTVRAQHPGFVDQHERLKSFETWPRSLQPRPEALAAAGFFYTGQSDRCVCFQCGGGLKDWSDSDDPWVEHAKFFPLCSYVIHNKGQDFITNCRAPPACNPSSESTSTENATPLNTAAPSSSTQASVIGNANENTNTTSSPSEASCSRTEASTEPSSSAAENSEEEKPSDTKTCTKEETKEDKSEAIMCKICYQTEMCIAFLPCGHVVACANCAPSFQQCAVCRKKVTATVRVYLS